jgi:hypothetical protein
LNDREKNGLRGRVASVRTEFFECDQQTGEVLKGPRRATIETYDRDGRTTSVVGENPNGSVSTSTYIYSGDGHLTEIRSELDGIVTGSAISQYDSNGRPVRTDQTQGGIKWQAMSCTYDDAGNKVEVQFPLPGSVLAEMIASARKAQQGSSGQVGYDVSLLSTRTTYYDSRGSLLEELRHNENQELIGRVSYAYDEGGRLAEKREEIGQEFSFGSALENAAIDPLEREAIEKALEQILPPGTSMFRTTYSYDDQNRKSEEITHQGPFGFSKQTFEYDEYGNVTATHYLSENSELQATPDGQLSNAIPPRRHSYAHRYGYTYDAHGNWIQKTLTSVDDANNQPHYADVERRIITYHSSEV